MRPEKWTVNRETFATSRFTNLIGLQIRNTADVLRIKAVVSKLVILRLIQYTSSTKF
jgi:hypothetical protein